MAEQIAETRTTPRPVLVGIVNITADSFSDGGRYLTPAAALAQARELRDAGAHVLELGPASSNPDAAPVPADEQVARLKPVLDALGGSVPVAADVTTPAVQDFVLERGVAILNDIQGFPDPARYPRLVSSTAQLVVMHSVVTGERAGRVATAPETIFDRVCTWFDARCTALLAAGVPEQRLIIDPGMGFFLGTDPAVSVRMLARTAALKARFGLPVMISVSRKSFLRRLTGRAVDTVGAATLAAELFAVAQGADYVRTHDVGALADALTVQRALEAERSATE